MTVDKTIAPQVPAAAKQVEKPSKSWGERLFDAITYLGISGVGAFLIGIPIGYSARYGKGAGMFNKVAKSLEKTGLSTKAAEDVLMTSVMMQPGNLAIAPVKIMENYKPELVTKFNKMLGDKSSDASVDNDPKQTWESLAKSRIAAWLAVFAGFRSAAMIFGNEKFAAFENSFAEHIVCKPLGKPTHIPGLPNIAENETRLFRYGKIAALDVFATAAATILLYMGSRFFAKRNERWHAKDTHSNTQEKPPATDALSHPLLPAPADKLYTDSTTPRQPETAHKTRPDTFAEAVSARKSSPSGPSLLMGA